VKIPATPTLLFRSASSVVTESGVAVTAVYGPVLGGIITNPQLAEDQGIENAEVLYLSVVGPATLGQTAGTISLQPGQSYVIPKNLNASISVNAATGGHKFSAFIQAPVPAITPQDGGFPPAGPTALLKTINAYLYVQYNDDSDLQAFISSYNNLTQQYLDWFNTINLPVYTNPNVSGALLDWAVEGLYTGAARPALSSGFNRDLGPLNTYNLNALVPLNTFKIIGPQDITATSDDFYRRIVTWNYYKGDGKVFNIRYLKRRIMRFLLGVNGSAPNVNNTYQVSVTFGTGNQVNIRLISGFRTVLGGALLNRFALNTKYLNEIDTKFTSIVPLQNTAILKEAIDSGVLQLPFQFTYVVTV
jgi:hypothetical protein